MTGIGDELRTVPSTETTTCPTCHTDLVLLDKFPSESPACAVHVCNGQVWSAGELRNAQGGDA